MPALPSEQVPSFALHQLLYTPKGNTTGTHSSLPTMGIFAPSHGNLVGQTKLTGSFTNSSWMSVSHHWFRQANWKWSKTGPQDALTYSQPPPEKGFASSSSPALCPPYHQLFSTETPRQQVCSVKGAWLTSSIPQVQQPSFVLRNENPSTRYPIAVSVLLIAWSQVKIYFQRREQQKAPHELWPHSLQPS